MTTPEDLPPPDLLDNAGRIRRIVVALLAGVAVAAVVFGMTNAMAEPEHLSALGGSRTRGYQFVWYATGLAGAISFVCVLKFQDWLANKQYQRERVPPAKIR